MARHRGPALVVDAAIAEHLEVLSLVPFGSGGSVEGIQHADAFDGLLLHAVDGDRLGETSGFENCRCDVDHMVKLRAELSLAFDSLRPVDDGAITRATPMGCDLLGPLIRRIHGVRPAHCVVVVGVRAAQLVEPGAEKLRRFDGGGAIEVNHLVVGTVQRPFGRRAVIADDIIDQRVLKLAELLQAVEHAADVVIGVF